MKVNVIGAGLAGSEAAYQLAKRGIRVRLYEMRPNKFTEAHRTEGLRNWCARILFVRRRLKMRWGCSKKK